MDEYRKPCPFCGKDRALVSKAKTDKPMYWVRCLSCASTGPTGSTRDEAILLWNAHKTDGWLVVGPSLHVYEDKHAMRFVEPRENFVLAYVFSRRRNEFTEKVLLHYRHYASHEDCIKAAKAWAFQREIFECDEEEFERLKFLLTFEINGDDYAEPEIYEYGHAIDLSCLDMNRLFYDEK